MTELKETEPRDLKTDLQVIDYAREVVVKYRNRSSDSQEKQNLMHLILHLSDIKAILFREGEVTLKEKE
jgi:hypothetical protein